MKKLLSLLATINLISISSFTTISCHNKQDKKIDYKYIEDLMQSLYSFHFQTEEEATKKFINLFENYDYIYFENSKRPNEAYSLLIINLNYTDKFTNQDQMSQVKDKYFEIEVVEAKKNNDIFEWDYYNSKKIKTTLLIGETEKFSEMEEIETNLGEILLNNWKKIYMISF